jgi:hypothetical protein
MQATGRGGPRQRDDSRREEKPPLPVDQAAIERALVQAIDRRVGRVLTEPLQTKELAEIFGCHRSKVAMILERIPGKQRIGRSWRVPLFSLPPRYLQELGLFPRP